MEPLIRIMLYMIGAFLVGMEYVSEDFVREMLGDPSLVGSIVLAISGVWYYMAKRFGWKT